VPVVELVEALAGWVTWEISSGCKEIAEIVELELVDIPDIDVRHFGQP
jgi:hypothetical protein